VGTRQLPSNQGVSPHYRPRDAREYGPLQPFFRMCLGAEDRSP
jgi:hypothetical protein